MTTLSKELNVSITSFMMNFYKFQEKMGITNQKCFHNVKYIKEYIKEKYNLTLKDYNGFMLLKNYNGNPLIQLEHNWIEYDGDIIEPNYDLYKKQLKNEIQYFKFSEKNKIYKIIKPSKKRKIEDNKYQREQLKKYVILNTSKTQYGIIYSTMIRTRIINKEHCDFMKDDVKEFNMIEQLKQMGGVHIYM